MDYPEYLGVLWRWAVTLAVILFALWLLGSWLKVLWRSFKREKKRLRSEWVQQNRKRSIETGRMRA